MCLRNDELALHFSGQDGEFLKFDYREDLRRILCPTLVMAGDRDPITPMSFGETIAANLPEHLVRFERFPGCGHGPTDEDPDRAFAVLRDFIRNQRELTSPRGSRSLISLPLCCLPTPTLGYQSCLGYSQFHATPAYVPC